MVSHASVDSHKASAKASVSDSSAQSSGHDPAEATANTKRDTIGPLRNYWSGEKIYEGWANPCTVMKDPRWKPVEPTGREVTSVQGATTNPSYNGPDDSQSGVNCLQQVTYSDSTSATGQTNDAVMIGFDADITMISDQAEGSASNFSASGYPCSTRTIPENSQLVSAAYCATDKPNQFVTVRLEYVGDGITGWIPARDMLKEAMSILLTTKITPGDPPEDVSTKARPQESPTPPNETSSMATADSAGDYSIPDGSGPYDPDENSVDIESVAHISGVQDAAMQFPDCTFVKDPDFSLSTDENMELATSDPCVAVLIFSGNKDNLTYAVSNLRRKAGYGYTIQARNWAIWVKSYDFAQQVEMAFGITKKKIK